MLYCLEGGNGPAEGISLIGKVDGALEAGLCTTYLLKRKQDRRCIEHGPEHHPGTVAGLAQELSLGALKDKGALVPGRVDGIQRSTLHAILCEIYQAQTGLIALIDCQYHRGIGNHRIRYRPLFTVQPTLLATQLDAIRCRGPHTLGESQGPYGFASSDPGQHSVSLLFTTTSQ